MSLQLSVRSLRDALSLMLAGAALKVGWTVIGGKAVYLVSVLWHAVSKVV